MQSGLSGNAKISIVTQSFLDFLSCLARYWPARLFSITFTAAVVSRASSKAAKSDMLHKSSWRKVLQSALVLMAVLCLARSVAAEATNGPPELQGWWQQNGANGVVYYICASDACGENSLMSFKAQQARTATVTLAEFENRHRQVAARNKGVPGIRDVRIADAKERSVAGVRVLQVSREMDWADGTTTFTIEARLIGSERTYSMVSGSPKSEMTVSNFENFMPRVAGMAAATGP